MRDAMYGMRGAGCRGDWLYVSNLRCKARADDLIAGAPRSLRVELVSATHPYVWSLAKVQTVLEPADGSCVFLVWFESVRIISGVWVLNQIESNPCNDAELIDQND
jgi:hypothetical protein